jgi:ASC-1-like (ASCH) protein
LQHVHHEYDYTSIFLEDAVQIWRMFREKRRLYAHDVEKKYGLIARNVGRQSEPNGIR